MFRYLNDFEERIPRSEVIEVEQIIKKTLHDLDPKYKVTICGSFRLVIKINNITKTIMFDNIYKINHNNIFHYFHSL